MTSVSDPYVDSNANAARLVGMRPVWNLPLTATGIEVALHNDSHVRIRPVRREDREALLLAFERFSEESRYFRFFGPRPELGDRLTSLLTDIDHRRHLAWAVFDPSQPSEVGDESGLAIASARIIVDEGDPARAEAAMAVVDAYHRRGIGRFLVELLVATAADIGAEVLRFEVLQANSAMRAMLTGVGATGHAIAGDSTVIDYHLPVPAVDGSAFPAGALYEMLRILPSGTPEPGPAPTAVR